MPNDNQAKSYISSVMARADGATPNWSAEPTSQCGEVLLKMGQTESFSSRSIQVNEANGVFAAHARQDIPTLAKMLLRAIAGLNEMRIRNSWAANVHADELLAEINAMAKGSQ